MAFKLCQALQKRTGLPKSGLNEVLDLLAVGTVAEDVYKRQVGTDGSLTGYACGIEKKRQLLTLERAELQKQEERKWVRQV